MSFKTDYNTQSSVYFYSIHPRLHNKVEELEERTQDIGRCHNDFCLMQQRYNKNTDEQLATIQEEIGSVYEHFEELSKGKEDGR
ncbi:exported protein [Streptococcus agalactiae FSL S3-026]|nr:exported protein [Streptococcus agalactiae FSL S3-026]